MNLIWISLNLLRRLRQSINCTSPDELFSIHAVRMGWTSRPLGQRFVVFLRSPGNQPGDARNFRRKTTTVIGFSWLSLIRFSWLFIDNPRGISKLKIDCCSPFGPHMLPCNQSEAFQHLRARVVVVDVSMEWIKYQRWWDIWHRFGCFGYISNEGVFEGIDVW